jgi:hypothetical protein
MNDIDFSTDFPSENAPENTFYGSSSSSTDEPASLPDITSDTPLLTNGMDIGDLINK